MRVNIKKLHENAIVPTYGTEFSAGADLYACMEEAVTILPGKTEMIHTGIAMEVPVGYAGLVYARSGLACKKGLAPANKVGVVDADYRGEIRVLLCNLGHNPVNIVNTMRIAQLVVSPCEHVEWEEVDELSDTQRGDGSFGSTGII